jgi:hypothetical protein
MRDPVEGDGEQGPEQDPGGDGDERRIARLRTALEQLRPDSGAERRPTEEPGERQRAREQAPLVADRGEGEGEDDDRDVDEIQGSGLRGEVCERILTRSKATTFPRPDWLRRATA